MESIDLVCNNGAALLTKQNRALDLVGGCIATLDHEANGFETRA
jgi:hypothetical protein